jgi:hypothetical protein
MISLNEFGGSMKHSNQETTPIASELRLNGYYMYSPKQGFSDTVYFELLQEFKNLLQIQIDEWKMYLVINEHGKRKVMRAIENGIYNNKRNLDWYQGRTVPDTDAHIIEIKRLKDLQKALNKQRF